MIECRQLSIICLSLAILSNNVGSESTSCLPYRCMSNPKLVNINENIYECPGNGICNQRPNIGQDSVCQPCIDPEPHQLGKSLTRILPPDCNDGFGRSDPCRPADPGSGYYFRCRRISADNYVAEIRSCYWKCFDVCFRNANICL